MDEMGADLKNGIGLCCLNDKGGEHEDKTCRLCSGFPGKERYH